MWCRAILLCVSLANCSAADDPDRLPAFQKLSNGLRICAIPRAASRLIDVQSWFRVGSSYDPPTLPGLTDAVRMLMLENLVDPPADRNALFSLDLRTTRDAVVYRSVESAAPAGDEDVANEANKNTLRALFESHAKSFKPLPISDRTFRALGAAVRPPHDPIESELLRTMFAGHPYQFQPSFVGDGRCETELGALKQHYERWFGTTNATVFVASPMPAERVFALAREVFGGIEWRDTPQRAAFDPPADEKVFLQTAGQHAADPLLIFCWQTPGQNWLDNYAIDVLFEYLLNAPDASLRKRLALEQCDCTWRRTAWKHAGIVALAIEVRRPQANEPIDRRRDRAKKAASVVAEELQKTATIPVDVEALLWARKRAAMLALMKRAHLPSSTSQLAEWEMLGGDILLADWEIPRIDRVSAGDLMMTATALIESRQILRAPDMPDWPGWRRAPASQPATQPSTSRPKSVPLEEWLPLAPDDRTIPMFERTGSATDPLADDIGNGMRILLNRMAPGSELVWIEVRPGDRAGGSDHFVPLALEAERWNKVLSDRNIVAWHGHNMRHVPPPTSWGLLARKEDFAAALEILLRQNKDRKIPEVWENPLVIHGDLDWPATLKIARRIVAECW